MGVAIFEADPRSPPTTPTLCSQHLLKVFVEECHDKDLGRAPK